MADKPFIRGVRRRAAIVHRDRLRMKRVDVWRLACAGSDIAGKPAAGVNLTDLATANSQRIDNSDDFS